MSAPCPQSEAESPHPRHRRPNRTREGQRAKRFRAELIAHLGGDPSITQLALVDQAVELKRRLLVMDRRFSRTEEFNGTAKEYLAWNNSLTRLLRQLGMQTPKQHVPTLVEYFTAKAKAAATATGETPEASGAPVLATVTGRSEAD
jgi:hypothetical protein